MSHSISLFASAMTSEGKNSKLEAIKPLTLNIYVEKQIRDHLNMRNSDRKAKVFLSQDVVEGEGEAQKQVTMKSLRSIIERRFPPLYHQPYVIRYGVKGINNDKPRQYASDTDVMTSVQHSFHSNEPISIYVETLPGVWPPPSHEYLVGMNDPGESETLTLLSFYKFYNVLDPEEISSQLEKLWKPFKATGRVYVAKEGINAQMAVPSNVLGNFEAACNSITILKDIKLNTDHVMSREDYYKAEPFRALHVRVRDQIVSDGFQKPLDWSISGREMSPLEWHQSLDKPNTVVLDCRNSYESDVGIFDNAIPLNTTFFRESWDALDSILKDKDKDTQIMTYCTGGIRCVKINAYLEQKLGFKNVNRLQGGIISYTRELEAVANQQDSREAAKQPHLSRNVATSKFKGVNYVFDERMSARITDDVLSGCETCGQPNDSFLNCNNYNCHIRFIQCGKCRERYTSCCSLVCQHEYKEDLNAENMKKMQQQSNTKHMRPRSKVRRDSDVDSESSSSSQSVGVSSSRSTTPLIMSFEDHSPDAINKQSSSSVTLPERDHASELDARLDALSDYCTLQSAAEPELLAKLREETATLFPQASRMVSGPLQGRILHMLTTLKQPSNVLELGTFTGYSSLCFAEGLSASNSRGAKVITCDIDETAAKTAAKYFALSPYNSYIDHRVMSGKDLLLTINSDNTKFDMVFIDADKKVYIDYMRMLLGEADGSNGRCLLNENALIIVDNTLWKGLVLEYMDGHPDLQRLAPSPELYGGKPERMKLLAKIMHDFNVFVNSHPALHPVILPLRDGLTIVRYSRSG